MTAVLEAAPRDGPPPCAAPAGDLRVYLSVVPAAQGARWDVGKWDVDRWDYAALTEVDASADVAALETFRGRTSVTGRYENGTAAVRLYNDHGWWSPFIKRESAGFANLEAGIPISVKWGTVPIYTGTAEELVETFVPSPHRAWVDARATDGFTQLAAVNLPEGAPVGAGETSGARIGRLADVAGWVAPRRLDAGKVTVQATTMAQPMLEEMFLTADSEGGQLYVDGDGTLVFEDRDRPLTDPRQTTPQVTFTDQPQSAAEVCYADLQMSSDRSAIVNWCSIARAGGTAQVASDGASIARYRQRTYTRHDLIHTADADSTVLAGRIVSRLAFASQRVEGLTVDLAAHPDARAAVCGLRLGDRVRVVRHHPSGALVVADLAAVGIGHAIQVEQETGAFAWQARVFTGPVLNLPELAVWDLAKWDADEWTQ